MVLRTPNALMHRDRIREIVDRIHHMWDDNGIPFRIGETVVDHSFMQKYIYLLPNLDLVIEDDMPDNSRGDIRGQVIKVLMASILDFEPVERIVPIRPAERPAVSEEADETETDDEADESIVELPLTIKDLDRLLGDDPDKPDKITDIEDYLE